MKTLDREILSWISTHTGDAALSAQLAGATVLRRDYMRTGFFVYLSAQEDAPDIQAGLRPVNPHIASAELMDGAGCNLFLKNGRLHYLEVYARGGFMPEELEQFELRDAE